MKIDHKKNIERGQRAYTALEYYKKELLVESGSIFDEDISDLLTDIKHLCDSHDYDFDACLRMAIINYNAERGYHEKIQP